MPNKPPTANERLDRIEAMLANERLERSDERLERIERALERAAGENEEFRRLVRGAFTIQQEQIHGLKETATAHQKEMQDLKETVAAVVKEWQAYIRRLPSN